MKRSIVYLGLICLQGKTVMALLNQRRQHPFSSSLIASPRSRRGSHHASSIPTSLYATTASTISNPLLEARRLVGQGMAAFRQADISSSIDLFDQAEAMAGPTYTPFLWQRGISYYYADRFLDASKQFQIDTRVNPRDTEEIVWDIASQLRADPRQAFPLATQISLPEGTKDPRRIMSAVYRLFRGEGSEYELMAAGQSKSPADEFYSLFYLGLFCEARGESIKAASYLTRAVSKPYAKGSGDYMTDVARVHCRLRGWMP